MTGRSYYKNNSTPLADVKPLLRVYADRTAGAVRESVVREHAYGLLKTQALCVLYRANTLRQFLFVQPSCHRLFIFPEMNSGGWGVWRMPGQTPEDFQVRADAF